MSPPDDSMVEMRRLPLDRGTADRLASGLVHPDDAPPGYREVARVLQELAAISASRHTSVMQLDVRAFTAAVANRREHLMGSTRGHGGDRPAHTTRHRGLVTALMAGATLVAMSGLAMAAGLPRAAEDLVHHALAGVTTVRDGGPRDDTGDVLIKLGIAPRGPDHPAVSAASAGWSKEAPNASNMPARTARSQTPPGVPTAGIGMPSQARRREAGRTSTTHPSNGKEISKLATSTPTTGADKGATISKAASHGRSRAGDTHGRSPAIPRRPASHAPDRPAGGAGGGSTATTPEHAGTAHAPGKRAPGPGDHHAVHTGAGRGGR
jgi:hypothetical protein